MDVSINSSVSGDRLVILQRWSGELLFDRENTYWGKGMLECLWPLPYTYCTDILDYIKHFLS